MEPNFGFSSQVRLYLSWTDSIASLKLSVINSFFKSHKSCNILLDLGAGVV